MKISIIILSALILAGWVMPVSGQNNKLQKEVQAVIDKYQNSPALKLDFEFQLTNPGKDPQIFEGTFYKLGEQYKVDLEEYTIIADGKIQYTIQKAHKEVQITTVDPETVELSSPAGVLKYLEDQDFKYFDQSALQQGGQTLKIVELIPTDKSSDYFKIRFSFTNGNELIKYIEIFGRDGQRIQLTVGDASFSGNFPKKMVAWDAAQYKDYYIEDLRID